MSALWRELANGRWVSRGGVPRARWLAELALGKPIPEGAHVHHVNGNSADDSPGNLVLCQDSRYHNSLESMGGATAHECEIRLQRSKDRAVEYRAKQKNNRRAAALDRVAFHREIMARLTSDTASPPSA